MRIPTKIIYAVTLVSSIFLFTFCTEIIDKNGVTAPKTITLPTVSNTVELSDGLKLQMNGIYSGNAQSILIGSNPVLNWNKNLLNLYTGNDYYTFVLKGGIRNDSLIFKGVSLDGVTKLDIETSFTSETDLTNMLTNGTVSFLCTFHSPNGTLIEKTRIYYTKKITNNLNNYLIIAHDGGGNDIFSSNSIAGIRQSNYTGANGMELDINISADGIPFCFHDDYFKFDNINSDFCVGPVTNFNMEDIKLLALLPDGGRVPTLDEALNTIVTLTSFETVWLDIKNASAIQPAIDAIKKYRTRAAALNRTVEVFIGLPTAEAVAQYKAANINPNQRPSILTELPPDVVQDINADAWGPQWDNSLNSAEQIAFIHSLGKRVLCWTIDDPGFFKQFQSSVKPDGIITNDPPKMIYEYLIQNN